MIDFFDGIQYVQTSDGKTWKDFCYELYDENDQRACVSYRFDF